MSKITSGFENFYNEVEKRNQFGTTINIDGALCVALMSKVFKGKKVTMFTNSVTGEWTTFSHNPADCVALDTYSRVKDLCCIGQCVIDMNYVVDEENKYNINRMFGISASKNYPYKYGMSTFITLLASMEQMGKKIDFDLDKLVAPDLTLMNLICRADSTLVDTYGKFAKQNELWWNKLTEGLDETSMTCRIYDELKKYSFILSKRSDEELKRFNGSFDKYFLEMFGDNDKTVISKTLFNRPDDYFFKFLSAVYEAMDVDENFSHETGLESVLREKGFYCIKIQNKNRSLLNEAMKLDEVRGCAVVTADTVSIQFDTKDADKIIEIYKDYIPCDYSRRRFFQTIDGPQYLDRKSEGYSVPASLM